MKNKGFTLIELMAVMLILGVISLIAIPVLLRVKDNYEIGTFRESAKSVITAAQNYYADNGYEDFPSEGLAITNPDLKVKNRNRYISGIVTYNSVTGKFELLFLSDGKYCASGTYDTIDVVLGQCTPNDSCFVFDELSGTIEKYNFDKTECPVFVQVPLKINNVTVEKIGDGAFVPTGDYYCYTDDPLAGSVQPNGYVKEATEKCLLKDIYDGNMVSTPLKAITLPNTIREIGDLAFAGSGLTTMSLGALTELTKINAGVFMGTTKLETIILPNNSNILEIDDYAFFASKIQTIDFKHKKQITSIGISSFESSSINIIDLTLAPDLQQIKTSAFYGLVTSPVILDLGNKPAMTHVGAQSFCDGSFSFRGETNIATYVSLQEISESCLGNILP